MITVKRWLPSILMAAFIFTLSSLSGAQVSSDPGVDRISHKGAHFVVYFVLCLTFYRATKSPVQSFLLTAFYGITDELHQLFVPTRNGNYFDIFVDSLAGFTAALFLWRFLPILPTKLKNWLLE